MGGAPLRLAARKEIALQSPQTEARRLARERRTMYIMIELYCRSAHRASRKPDSSTRGAQGAGPAAPAGVLPEKGLCPECAALYAYASRRIERCRFGAEKPVCAKCPAHCYKPDMRETIRAVMRYAGPRMLVSHPILAVRHMLERAKRVPPAP